MPLFFRFEFELILVGFGKRCRLCSGCAGVGEALGEEISARWGSGKVQIRNGVFVRENDSFVNIGVL